MRRISRLKTRIAAGRTRIRTRIAHGRTRIRSRIDHGRTRLRTGIQRNVVRMKQSRHTRKLPTALTFVNAVLGFLALVSVYSEEYAVASLLIVAAFVFDILDGLMARALEATSAFGVELDSLADAVTFVIAPAMLIYFKFFQTPRIGIVVATFAVICGIARLAKFNASSDSRSFVGMPTPFFAALVISLVFLDIPLRENVAALLFFLLASLMISPVKYPNFKDEATKKYRVRGVAALVIMAAVLALPIGMMWKAVAANALFWLLFIPFLFGRAVRRRKFTVLFVGGMALATVAFVDDPLFLLALPGMYAVIAAPLLQAAMMERQVG
jgi:CDP-diacylglycerol--serine O-phosphatidyltransferase